MKKQMVNICHLQYMDQQEVLYPTGLSLSIPTSLSQETLTPLPTTLTHKSGINFDNHLGTLYNNIRAVYKNIYHPYTNQINKHISHFEDVEYNENAMDVTLARQVREFINQIPYNEAIPQLSNDNPPKHNVFDESRNIDKINDAFDNPICDPNEWSYEKYDPRFMRLLPNTLRSFIGSPVFEMLSVFENKYPGHIFQTACIQLLNHNQELRPHTDLVNSERQISCLYYLCPDDWTYGNGGCLGISKSGKFDVSKVDYSNVNMYTDFTLIKPKFNACVGWNLEKKDFIHHVTKVNVHPNKKKRFTLVLFYRRVDS